MVSIKKIDEAIGAAILQGVFPGAALGVGRLKKTLFKECYGLAEKIPVERKLTPKTYFDIASLTKPLATTAIAQCLYEKGKLDLNAPLTAFFPRLREEKRSKITVRHLLQHTSGLPAYKPYFEKLAPELSAGTSPEEIQKELLKKILSESPEGESGGTKIYSDLGFILLGVILERLTEKPLDRLFQELVAKPLGLEHTFFIRLNGKGRKLARTDFASTSKCPFRRKILAGEVEDEHAWLLQGVAGHAGLFSTLGDLMKMAEEFLKVDAGESKWMKRETFRSFVDPRPPLGWDTPLPQNSQAGSLFSKETIGHLGFTGCSIWIDLANKFYVLLLTNRVHPNRYNEAIKIFRPKIHDLILQTLRLSKPL